MPLQRSDIATLIFAGLWGWAALAWGQSGVLQMRPDGPKAQELGQDTGYRACEMSVQRPVCRVGAWSSAFPEFLRRTVEPSPEPMPLPQAQVPTEISWRWGFSKKTIDDYMNEAQITGLLIIRDGQVVAERYQYDRQPGMPMRSFSMAKTFTSMLVGIALEKGLIRSLDDMAAQYWPEIADSAYGQTSLRNLLRMSSGVRFRELYTWTPDDDNWVWGQVLYLPENKAQPQKIIDFLNQRTQRDTPAGQRFSYASIETEILGRVLTKATGQSIAKLTEEWLWKPMGAQDRAYWLFSSTDGTEATAGGFNASLRDYGRFGVLLANNGQRDGQSIIPTEYLLDATDANRQPRAFQPRVATPFLGYGYQTWILPYRSRTFALQGIHGQTIYVQPDSKIVMVQTAVYNRASGAQDDWPYRLRQALWEGVLQSLGGTVN